MKRSELEDLCKLHKIQKIKQKNIEALVNELVEKNIIKIFDIKNIRKINVQDVIIKSEQVEESECIEKLECIEEDTEITVNSVRCDYLKFLQSNIKSILELYNMCSPEQDDDRTNSYIFLFDLYGSKDQIYEDKKYCDRSDLKDLKVLTMGNIYLFKVCEYVFAIVYEKNNIYLYSYDNDFILKTTRKKNFTLIKMTLPTLHLFIQSCIDRDYEFFCEIMGLENNLKNMDDEFYFLEFNIKKIPQVKSVKPFLKKCGRELKDRSKISAFNSHAFFKL